MNHYATDMFFNKGGRHYWFAKYLIREGYKPTIFCANTRHGSGDGIEIADGKYIKMTTDSIPFVFVKTVDCNGSNLKRIENMMRFSWNLYAKANEYTKYNGKPDVIVASSVHPLTLVAGIKIAKRLGVPCICEIRDLWPESLIDYGFLKRNGIIAKILYQGEKWIYKSADRLIFTMEGGKDYIIEKGWDKKHNGPIDLNKVHHINNGIDLDAFDYNEEKYVLYDQDLKDSATFKVIYTGSIRLVNNVEKVIDVAKLLKEQNIKFLIWGDGDQLENLRKSVEKEQIENVRFKGVVDKKYIPFITSRAQLNIAFGGNMSLFRFGTSMNKMFDYFASGKPTLVTFKMGYSLLEKYGSGIELHDSSAEMIARSIMYFKNLDEMAYNEYCKNARQAAEEYSYKNLTNLLIKVIRSCWR